MRACRASVVRSTVASCAMNDFTVGAHVRIVSMSALVVPAMSRRDRVLRPYFGRASIGVARRGAKLRKNESALITVSRQCGRHRSGNQCRSNETCQGLPCEATGIPSGNVRESRCADAESRDLPMAADLIVAKRSSMMREVDQRAMEICLRAM